MRKSSQTVPRAAALLVVGIAMLPGQQARAADAKAQCIAAYEQGQKLKQESKLSEARKQLLVCIRDVCPDALSHECEQWLKEVDGAMPSVVFAAKGPKGTDVTDVRVTVDGKVVTEKLDGKAIPMDPGDHTFKFEYGDAPPIEQSVLVREGEKLRAINVNFGGGGSDPGPGTPKPEPGAVHSTPAMAYVLGGLGIVALGSFTYFGLTGKSKADDLQSCKPYCDKSEVDATRTKLIVADVSLGVGLVSLGIATYLFLSKPDAAPTTSTGLQLNIGPTAGGAFAGVSSHF